MKVWICVYMHVCMSACVYMFVWMCVLVFACMCYISMCLCVHMYLWAYVRHAYVCKGQGLKLGVFLSISLLLVFVLKICVSGSGSEGAIGKGLLRVYSSRQL